MPRVKENIALEFDMFSSDYTRDMINCVPHYIKLMQSIVEALPANIEIDSVLDMGCGNGNVTDIVLNYFPNATFQLIDASPEMIRICQGRFPNAEMSFWEGYFNDFKFDLAPYDLVTASFSFHHIDGGEKQQIFKSIFDALRPGGILAMSDLMIHKTSPEHPELIKEWSDFILSNHGDTEKLEWIMEHYEAFDRPDHFKNQIKWLEETGFSEVKIPWRKGYWVSLQAVK